MSEKVLENDEADSTWAATADGWVRPPSLDDLAAVLPETSKPPCRTCKKSLEYCPMCGGADPTDYAHQGQGDDGYWVCQNEECDDYQFCCGC